MEDVIKGLPPVGHATATLLKSFRLSSHSSPRNRESSASPIRDYPVPNNSIDDVMEPHQAFLPPQRRRECSTSSRVDCCSSSSPPDFRSTFPPVDFCSSPLELHTNSHRSDPGHSDDSDSCAGSSCRSGRNSPFACSPRSHPRKNPAFHRHKDHRLLTPLGPYDGSIISESRNIPTKFSITASDPSQGICGVYEPTTIPTTPPSVLSPKQNSSVLSPKQSPSLLSPKLSPSGLSPKLSPSGLSPKQSPSLLSPKLSPSGLSPKLSPSGLSPKLSPSVLSPKQSPSLLSPQQSPNVVSLQHSPLLSPHSHSPVNYWSPSVSYLCSTGSRSRGSSLSSDSSQGRQSPFIPKRFACDNPGIYKHHRRRRNSSYDVGRSSREFTSDTFHLHRSLPDMQAYERCFPSLASRARREFAKHTSGTTVTREYLLQLAVAMRAHLEAFCQSGSIFEFIKQLSLCCCAAFKAPLVLAFVYDAETDELISYFPAKNKTWHDVTKRLFGATQENQASDTQESNFESGLAFEVVRVSGSTGFLGSKFRNAGLNVEQNTEWGDFDLRRSLDSLKKSRTLSETSCISGNDFSHSTKVLNNIRKTRNSIQDATNGTASLENETYESNNLELTKLQRPHLGPFLSNRESTTQSTAIQHQTTYDSDDTGKRKSFEAEDEDSDRVLGEFLTRKLTALQKHKGQPDYYAGSTCSRVRTSSVAYESSVSVTSADQQKIISSTSFNEEPELYSSPSSAVTSCVDSFSSSEVYLLRQDTRNTGISSRRIKGNVDDCVTGTSHSERRVQLAATNPAFALRSSNNGKTGRCRRLSSIFNVLYGGLAPTLSPRLIPPAKHHRVSLSCSSPIADNSENCRLSLAFFETPPPPSPHLRHKKYRETLHESWGDSMTTVTEQSFPRHPITPFRSFAPLRNQRRQCSLQSDKDSALSQYYQKRGCPSDILSSSDPLELCNISQFALRNWDIDGGTSNLSDCLFRGGSLRSENTPDNNIESIKKTPDTRLQTPDTRLQTPDTRLQTPDTFRRLQTNPQAQLASRLHTLKEIFSTSRESVLLSRRWSDGALDFPDYGQWGFPVDYEEDGPATPTDAPPTVRRSRGEHSELDGLNLPSSFLHSEQIATASPASVASSFPSTVPENGIEGNLLNIIDGNRRPDLKISGMEGTNCVDRCQYHQKCGGTTPIRKYCHFEKKSSSDNEASSNPTSVPILCRTLFNVQGLAVKVPIGMLCIISPTSESEENQRHQLLDHVAHQTQGLLRQVTEIDRMRKDQAKRNILLDFYRAVYKDMSDIDKAVHRLLQLVQTAMNVSEVVMFIADYASRDFICCSGNPRTQGLRLSWSDPLMGPCFHSKSIRISASPSTTGTPKMIQQINRRLKSVAGSGSFGSQQHAGQDVSLVPASSLSFPANSAPGDTDWSKTTSDSPMNVAISAAELLAAESLHVEYDAVAGDIITRSVMCVPLMNAEGVVMAVLKLINRYPSNVIPSHSTHSVRFSTFPQTETSYPPRSSFGTADFTSSPRTQNRISSSDVHDRRFTSRQNLRDRYEGLDSVITFSREDEAVMQSLSQEITLAFGGPLSRFCLQAVLRSHPQASILQFAFPSYQHGESPEPTAVPGVANQRQKPICTKHERPGGLPQHLGNIPKINCGPLGFNLHEGKQKEAKPSPRRRFSFLPPTVPSGAVSCIPKKRRSTCGFALRFTNFKKLDENEQFTKESNDVEDDCSELRQMKTARRRSTVSLISPTVDTGKYKANEGRTHTVDGAPGQSESSDIMSLGRQHTSTSFTSCSLDEVGSFDNVSFDPAGCSPRAGKQSDNINAWSEPASISGRLSCDPYSNGDSKQQSEWFTEVFDTSPLFLTSLSSSESLQSKCSSERVHFLEPIEDTEQDSSKTSTKTRPNSLDNCDYQNSINQISTTDSVSFTMGEDSNFLSNTNSCESAAGPSKQPTVPSPIHGQLYRNESTVTFSFGGIENESESTIQNVEDHRHSIHSSVSATETYQASIGNLGDVVDPLNSTSEFLTPNISRSLELSLSPSPPTKKFTVEFDGILNRQKSQRSIIDSTTSSTSVSLQLVQSKNHSQIRNTSSITRLAQHSRISGRKEQRRVSEVVLRRRARNPEIERAVLAKKVQSSELPRSIPLSEAVDGWGVVWWKYPFHDLADFFVDSIQSFGLFESLSIGSPRRMKRFFAAVANSYNRANPYHNFFHAIQVYHVAWMLLSKYRLSQYLTDTEIFGVLIGSLCHDIDHPGLNNDFFISIQHPTAVVYNDISVLENYHCAFTFRLLESNSHIDFRKNMRDVDQRAFRRTFIKGVLGTDMQTHSQKLANFSYRAQRHESEPWSFNSVEDRNLLVEMIPHAADLSNPLTPDPLFKNWASLILEEFNRQTVREAEMGLEVTAFMNCATEKQRLDCQIGFSEFIVLPMWRTMALLLPELKPVVDQGEENARYWHSVADQLADRPHSNTRHPPTVFTFYWSHIRHLHPTSKMTDHALQSQNKRILDRHRRTNKRRL